MKTPITLEVKPFEAPYYVKAFTPSVPGQESEEFSVPIAQVDAVTLGAMCDAFRAAIFKQAGKTPPGCYMNWYDGGEPLQQECGK